MRTLGPSIRSFDARCVKPEGKTVDPFYLTPEYQQWRKAVMVKAGWRCESVEHGIRCAKHSPDDRLFADHIREVKDGGARYDVANGQALCGSHHTSKTTQARAARLRG